jgi:hypothetical protein
VPYRVEYKRTADSTWTLFSAALSQANFPITIPGLVASTQYDVRCLAQDLSGNVSTYSAVTQASTAVAADVTAPTAPTITTTQTGSASASVALTTASTDIGGSGVATYAVEYKRNVDSTYTVAAAAITAAQFPYSLTGLAPSTLYDTRARATDVAGNVGAYSAVSQATTQASALLPPTGSFFRLINVDQTANPWKSSTTTSDTKHVPLIWHPVKRRVYTGGGDTDDAAGFAGQPASGQTSNTNESPPRSYVVSSGYRKDIYSIDPTPSAAASVPYRLEHPYWPRNLGSNVREARPTLDCQDSWVWDTLRSKLWYMQSHIRGVGDVSEYRKYGFNDPWAFGDLWPADNTEPAGIYSFTPGLSGSPGGWILESPNALVCKTPQPVTPTYNGGRLEIADYDERIPYFDYDGDHDRIVTFGANGNGVIGFFSLNPATFAWEWRRLGTSFSYCQCNSQLAYLNGWLYGVARVRTPARESRLVAFNMANCLALANGASIPNNSTYFQSWLLPFSLSPNAEWEISGGDNAKYPEHAGVVAIEGNIVICASYDGLVDSEGTKLAVFVPSNGQFYRSEAAPDSTMMGNAWCALPETNELLFTHGTFGYNDHTLVAYQTSHLGPLSLSTFNAAEGTDPIVNGDSGGLAYWTSAGRTSDGKLIFYGAGTHSGNIDNGVREWNPNVGGASVYVKPSNNSTCDVTQYNNHAWFFSEQANMIVVPSQGIYDRTLGQWVAGGIAPCGSGYRTKVSIGTGANAILYADPSVDFNGTTYDYINGGSTLYNAHTAWSPELDCGIYIGGTPGTASGVVPNIHLIVPSNSGVNATAVSQGNRWTIFRRGMPATVSGVQPYKGRARDACCILGEYVYWVGGDDPDLSPGGPTNHFFRMKITPHLTSKTVSLTGTGAGAIERLTNCPIAFTFGLMMPEPYLNALLLITSLGIYAWDATYQQWTNVTPATYNSALFDNKGMPFGCFGKYIDKTGSTTHRRFYWRPGYNQIASGQFWDDVPIVAKYKNIMSLKLKRN